MALKHNNFGKTAGPDGFRSSVLTVQNCAASLHALLILYFSTYPVAGCVPYYWKLVSVVPVHRRVMLKIKEKCLKSYLVRVIN